MSVASYPRPEDRARRLEALLRLGFERVEEPLVNDVRRLAGGDWHATQTVPSMGTLVSITAVAGSRERVEEALGRAFAEMCRAVDILNRYEASSALGVLNQEGRLASPPPDLLAVLEGSRRLHALSDGAFDATVAPVVDRLRHRFAEGLEGPIPETELTGLLARVGAACLRLAADEIRLQDGTRLTLDGIAKGYVVDRMAATLEAAGLSRYLINAGGDVRSSGSPDDGRPWRVAVRDPEGGEPLDVVPVRSGALATSGSYEIHFDDERASHHIVRAADGRCPGEAVSVTVRAPTAMQADALATAVFVMGTDKGLRLIDHLPECEGLVHSVSGSFRSSGWTASPSPSGKSAAGSGRSRADRRERA